MRNLLLIVCFIASAICASAQKVYFIYLQSDNNSPFYVKMSDKIYSSAASGYLILSNLVDSTYNFSIGFPSAQSESRFVVTLGAKDRGFLIKNFESGLGLYDLQNLSIIKEQKDQSANNISYIKRDDGFSSLLSKAAKDTSLLYAVVRVKEKENPAVKESSKDDDSKQTAEATLTKDTTAVSSQTDIALEAKKQDTVTAQSDIEAKKGDSIADAALGDVQKDTLAHIEQPLQQTADSTAVAMIDTLSKTEKPVTGTAEEEQKMFIRSRIKKHSESSTSEGFGLVYYDIYEGGSDTIRLLIPNPPIIFRQPGEDSSSLVQRDFIHVDDINKDTEPQKPIVATVKNNAPVKSQCKSVASNNDFFKLRKNMAAENTDEGMVAEAKKFFRSKCFTTEQVKNLSALFLTSAGKYQFFDAAYLYVSDQEKFPSLEAELKDDYYLKRFRAMIGE